jgi:hypothetical protein
MVYVSRLIKSARLMLFCYKDITMASATGIFSPNVLNRRPVEGQQVTGLLSGQVFAWPAPKPAPSVQDALLTLVFAVLSRFVSILRRFIPSSVWNSLVRTSHVIYLGTLKSFTRCFLYLP